MQSSSQITISKAALEINLNFIRSILRKDVEIVSVIKGNAYGHGIEAFVPLAISAGINHFAVYSVQEAYRAHAVANEHTEFMIMGYVEGSALKWAIANQISFFIFDVDRLKEAIRYSKELGVPAKVHLEVETGLNRTGIDEANMLEALEIIEANNGDLEILGVCTHLAGAESIANDARIKQQLRRFNQYKSQILAKGWEPKYWHTACSAALLSYPKSRMNLVRVGILQYGFWPSQETFIQYLTSNKINSDPLKRLIAWKTKIMSIKQVNQGEFIGYGTSFLAAKNMRIGIIPVGYADGYSRNLSNYGRVVVNGVRLPVVGLVNMNTLMIDISEVEDVKNGDTVYLIGGQEGEINISVASFGELSNQLNYELLTRLPHHIPRLIQNN